MSSKTIMISLMLMLLTSHYTNAGQVKSVSEAISSSPFAMLDQSRESVDAKMRSCETDKNAVVTIYSTTGKAQVGIDVKLRTVVFGGHGDFFRLELKRCSV